MNQQIENNLVQGLVRIFSAYGWAGDQSQVLSQRIALINWGIHHGHASTYLSYLRNLIETREKNHDWWPFTSIFVYGIETLLESYADFNDLFTIPVTASDFKVQEPTKVNNVFTDTEPGIAAIRRLRTYGRTCIRYSYIEEYGVDKLQEDLRKIFPHGEVLIRNDNHQPDQLREWVWDEGSRKMTIYHPIMPVVLLATSHIK